MPERNEAHSKEIMQGRRDPGQTLEILSDEFRVEVLSNCDFPTLVKKMRTQINSLGEQNVFPYAQSTIELVTVDPRLIHPSSLYLLGNQVENVGLLGSAFHETGVDLTNMTTNQAKIEFKVNGASHTIIPPVIEISEEDGGIRLITDGGHRLYKWIEEGVESARVILITKPALPHPSLPVPWCEVQLLDKVPPDSLKRRPRYKTHCEHDDWIAKNIERYGQGLVGKRVQQRSMEDIPAHYRFFRNLKNLD